MEGLSPRLLPQNERNSSRLNIDSIKSSDAMVDSAAKLGATVRPPATDNGSGGPSDTLHADSASTVQRPMINVANLKVLNDSAHHRDHAMPDVQRNNQRPTQNRMAINYILNSDSSSRYSLTEASVTNGDSTIHGEQSGSTASTGEEINI